MTDVAVCRLRVASPATVLVLGGLVLALTIAAVPLASLAHQGLDASRGSVPVWVSAPSPAMASTERKALVRLRNDEIPVVEARATSTRLSA